MVFWEEFSTGLLLSSSFVVIVLRGNLFLIFISFFIVKNLQKSVKNTKKQILTLAWSTQHPNAGRSVQQ